MSAGFWTLPNINAVRTPTSILKEQANILSQATRGLLLGNIETSTVLGSLYIKLEIIVPALNNYKYGILRCDHVIINSYPAKIHSDILRTSEEANNEDEFNAILHHLLSSQEVQNVLQGLITQASAVLKS